jgi:hypothetical protein
VLVPDLPVACSPHWPLHASTRWFIIRLFVSSETSLTEQLAVTVSTGYVVSLIDPETVFWCSGYQDSIAESFSFLLLTIDLSYYHCTATIVVVAEY